MNRWMISTAICAVALVASAATAADLVPVKVGDSLAYAPPGAVRCAGWTGAAIETCRVGRIFGQSVPDLVRPFEERVMTNLWRCEFWGKWFTSAALAYRYRPDAPLKDVLNRAAGGLVAAQSSNGCISTYRPDAELKDWDVWGRKYSLLGLLAQHEATGDAAALEAAKKLADYTISQFGPGKKSIAETGLWTGMAAGSILEPMALLHRRTGEARYLEFAETIVRAWSEPAGPDLVRKALDGVTVFKMFPGPDPAKKGYMSGGSSKAYEMMSCYEGRLELHRTTGETRYAEAARKVFDDILATEITVLGSGSSWERWCDGRRRQVEDVPEWMETCVTVTWMKFAAQLLRLTGESRYADEIERAQYNALLAAQKGDGTWWCHYNPLEGARTAAPEHCRMHQNCCVANGPRALMLLPALAAMSAKDGPVVNAYEPAAIAMPLPSGRTVKLEVRSDYPRPGPVEIVVTPDRPEAFTLGLRIPAWSRATSVEINGKAGDRVRPGTYAKIARTWRPGDTVKLAFDFGVRMEKDPGGSGRVAVIRGPVVFALDRRISRPVAGAGNGALAASAGGLVEAAGVTADLPAGIRMALDVPFEAAGKRVTVRMCDYASAGSTWAADSTLRVWLPQPLNLANPFEGTPETKPTH